jgi:hypothetical protein
VHSGFNLCFRHCVAPEALESGRGMAAAYAGLLVGVLKGRTRLQRVLGRTGKNQLVVDQLEV